MRIKNFIVILILLCLKEGGASQFTLPDFPWSEKQEKQTVPYSAILDSSNAISLHFTSPKINYRLGEKMSLTIRSNSSCYLTVLDFSTSGYANILFPNKYQQNNLLKANRSVVIPNDKFEIKLSGKTGKEQLWAVCRLNPSPPFSKGYDFNHTIFSTLGKTSVFKLRYQMPLSAYSTPEEAWLPLLININK